MKVTELKSLVFSRLSLNEQIALKNSGRPTPELHIVQEQPQYKHRNSFKRKFDKNIYNKTIWICGCEETNSFFCFVCLLFGGGDDDWTKNGVNDLKHLSLKIKKHEQSFKHKNNIVSFQMLGKINIATSISSAYTEQIRKHNETVKKNRQVLSKIIDILKLCGTCNLPLHGYNEKKGSLNKGVFLELIDFLANADGTFNSHIQEPTVFKATSKTIQNEILQCMLSVSREHILEETKKTQFLAVMTDDTTDVSTLMQTVIVLRYELNGKIHERFWGFANPESQDSSELSKCILQQISPILEDCPDKLISQTYDGAAVMRCHVVGVNVKIQEHYKNAHFVYCYAHQLNKIIEQTVSSIISVRVFFSNLKGMSTFFSQSPDRMAALNDVCDKHIPRLSETCWNFHSLLVQSVFNNREEIIECFENIVAGIPKNYNVETVKEASGFLKWLEDDNFLFWLNFFSKVMTHVDILYSQIQKIETDVVKIQICIDRFEKEIENVRCNLPSIANDTERPREVEKKRRRLNEENINISAREVCDIIISEVKHRFAFKDHLSGAKLFLKECYIDYKKNLPFQDIEKFCNAYPMVDKEALKIELAVFYSREEVTDSASESANPNESENFTGCLPTLNFIISFGLESVFKEIVKVIKILVTIPMTTSETERCFSTLKLIKSFLRSTMNKESITALAMLSIEKTMVHEIENFNEKVIDKFIEDKNRRMIFHFKS
ncbi:unnamed protein product [Psylliodes chrysocephalus]|uniref:Zinc finger MYM-type protein 1-like n=1 Tax=Psylliodes chrysocephalus TaxID=3402493 RepID=A0A9P0D8X0_9CUCU|nr:unnamed protein product [Psylliodes chrysocephala]